MNRLITAFESRPTDNSGSPGQETGSRNGVLRLGKAGFQQSMNSFWKATAKSVRGSISDASIHGASHRARKVIPSLK